MASENETVAEIVGLMRDEGYYRGFMGITNPLTDRMVSSLLDRIEAAHRREIAELREFIESACEIYVRQNGCAPGRKDDAICAHDDCDQDGCPIKKWRKAIEVEEKANEQQEAK